MKNRITTDYVKGGTQISVTICGTHIGNFTLAEKYFDQLNEFYNDNIISLKELQFHIYEISKKGGHLKSKLIGKLSFYFYIYKKNPNLSITISKDYLKGNTVSLAYFTKPGIHSFVVDKNSKVLMILSGYILRKDQAIDFLDFLNDSKVINNKRTIELEQIIEESFIPEGNLLTLMN